MRLFVCFTLLFILFPAHSSTDNPYLQELIESARTARLSSSPEWLALLHYKDNTFSSGHTSEADDTTFFLAKEGNISPQNELEDTLTAFFTPPSEAIDSHPQCRFPARFYWLNNKLGFKQQLLTHHHCTEYEQWLATLKPDSVTLVFPESYINSPSSMFGHTLLRINPPDDSSPLTAYALNYAANIENNDTGIGFAYKGIFGGYPGVFSIVPYYEKINEYGEIENRDIWEYNLNLSPKEVAQLMRHTWELRYIRFDYYFIDENCSYRLLSLLDVARPGNRLASQHSRSAIPADTTRTLLKAALVKDKVYRPSRTTLLKHQLGLMTKQELRLVKKIINYEITIDAIHETAMTATSSARTLDFAYNTLRYNATAQPELRDKNAKLEYALLTKISTLETSDAWPTIPTPKISAEQGHLSSRLALGIGQLEDREFVSLKYRPAYHDTLDPTAGYQRGAQINFFDMAARYYQDTKKSELTQLAIIDILSLSQRGAIFKPLSWGVNLGIERSLTLNDSHNAQITGLVGHTYPIGRHGLFSALLESKVELNHNMKKGFSAAAGIRFNLLIDYAYTDANILIKHLRFGIGEKKKQQTLSWEQSLHISNNYDLRLSASIYKINDQRYNEQMLSIHKYF